MLKKRSTYPDSIKQPGGEVGSYFLRRRCCRKRCGRRSDYAAPGQANGRRRLAASVAKLHLAAHGGSCGAHPRGRDLRPVELALRRAVIERQGSSSGGQCEAQAPIEGTAISGRLRRCCRRRQRFEPGTWLSDMP